MVKNQFVDLIAFLEANSNKKVSSILAEAIAIASKKNVDTTFYKDDTGTTIACRDYYFKKWMLIADVEWATKENTASGYNQMCKAGLSAWTKQQRDAKKASSELLAKLADGSLAVSDLATVQAEIEATRVRIDLSLLPTDKAYDTVEELLVAKG